MSAETLLAASALAAPQTLADCFTRLPPRTKTSTTGCSTSRDAVAGLGVTIIALRFWGSAAAAACAVVPLPRITVEPGVISCAARTGTDGRRPWAVLPEDQRGQGASR